MGKSEKKEKRSIIVPAIIAVVVLSIIFVTPALNWSQKTDYHGFRAGGFAEYQLGNGTSMRFTIESVYRNGTIDLSFDPNKTIIGLIGIARSAVTYYSLLVHNIEANQNRSEQFLPSFQASHNFAPWFLDVNQTTLPTAYLFYGGWNGSGSFKWSYKNGTAFVVGAV